MGNPRDPKAPQQIFSSTNSNNTNLTPNNPQKLLNNKISSIKLSNMATSPQGSNKSMGVIPNDKAKSKMSLHRIYSHTPSNDNNLLAEAHPWHKLNSESESNQNNKTVYPRTKTYEAMHSEVSGYAKVLTQEVNDTKDMLKRGVNGKQLKTTGVGDTETWNDTDFFNDDFNEDLGEEGAIPSEGTSIGVGWKRMGRGQSKKTNQLKSIEEAQLSDMEDMPEDGKVMLPVSKINHPSHSNRP